MPRAPERRILVFLKEPQPGRVKTRLAEGVGAGPAASLYRAMTEDLLEALSPFGREVIPCYTGADVPPALAGMERLGEPMEQVDGDLGHRMATAFERCFDGGGDRVILLGSDVPGIDTAVVKNYLRRLEVGAMVLGPSADGGYYLIGFDRAAYSRDFFAGVRWSSREVWDQTLAVAHARGLGPYVGPTLSDVDTVDDLAAVRAVAGVRASRWLASYEGERDGPIHP